MLIAGVRGQGSFHRQPASTLQKMASAVQEQLDAIGASKEDLSIRGLLQRRKASVVDAIYFTLT